MDLLKHLIERVQLRHTTKKSTEQPTSNITKHNNKLDDVQTRQDSPSSLDSEHVKHIGAGAESVVFKNTKKADQTGVVTKWLRNQRTKYNENPVIVYLLLANKHNNPMAPVVYEIKAITNPDQTYDYYIKMERLHKTLASIQHDIEQPQVDALFRQVIDGYDDQYPLNMSQLVRVLKHGITDTEVEINGKIYQYTDTLAELNDYINMAIMKYNGKIDMHGSNIMIRLTSVGMQLVLTDPIYTGA